MSSAEQNKYPPGIYLEIYHARSDAEFKSDYNGLHSYLVLRTPMGEEYVLRGGEPTEAQGWLSRATGGVLGGYIEVQTGDLARSRDAYNGRYRPHRMVIPVKTGAYDVVLWESAKARVEEIGRQKYDYDVTDSAQLFTGGAQNSNSVVAAALRQMGINPLDIISDDLIPHLPGIQNDLTHRPDETAPTGNSLTTPRTGRPKPKPLNSDLLKKEEQLRKRREEQERQQLKEQEQRLPSLKDERKSVLARIEDKPESAQESETTRLEKAATTPPDALDSALLSDPKRWNHAQLTTAMQSDEYWQSWKPRSGMARAKVSEAFEALAERSKPGARATSVQPEEMPEPPAETTARGGEPLKSAQARYARELGGMARKTGPVKATRAAQTALNRFAMRSDAAPEPLKTDGDFGPKTQAATRQALHAIGEPELTRETRAVLDEEHEASTAATIGQTIGAGFQPEFPR